MPHVDEGLLHAYLDGELAGVERDQILAHLGECVACRTRLEEERALVARASEILARAVPPRRQPAAFTRVAPSRAPSWRVPAAWAATVTIAFGIGWYAQGERLAHELAGRATPPELSGPVPAKARPSPSPMSQEAAGMAREDAARRVAAPAPRAASPPTPLYPEPQRQAAASRDEAAAWPALDADAAHALLGRAPAVLPGVPVRRMLLSPTDEGVVVIEQEWKPGIVLRLYERRAISAGSVDAAQPLSGRAARSAAPPPSAQMSPLHGENLARYISSLRVEIAGPIGADSLAQLLDSVE